MRSNLYSVIMCAMLKIRLKRVGRKHDPSYRVVVTEKHRGPKSGKYIENLGSYDARTDTREIKGDRVKHWMSVGAQLSDTVHNLLVKEGIIEGKAKNVLPKKSPIVSEKPEETPAEETPAEAPEATQDESLAEETPSEETPAEEAPAEEDPVEETPAEEAPVEEATGETPTEESAE